MVQLFKPFMPSELPELNNILHSGGLSYGKWGRLFEEKLGDYISNPLTLVMNSYNSAVLVALATLDLKAGDEIIASPMSCLASNQPFATQGLTVCWADIDPLTGTLDPESVRSKISSRTKAIFHNHFCGYPGHINEINHLGKEYGIFIVDDAIESFGSEYQEKKIGISGADLTIFSFQTVRLPNTIDGGGISFNNTQLYQKAMLIRDYGIDRKIFRDLNGEISQDCDITDPAYGATLNEINSYIGCAQMDSIDNHLLQQRKNASAWKIKIADYKNVHPLKPVNSSLPNYWVFGVLSSDKLVLMNTLRREGYFASGVHLPNNYYSVFKDKKPLKGVNEFYSRFLALPSGWWFDLSLVKNV